MMGREDGRPGWRGAVVSVHVAADGGRSMRATEEVRAVQGRGLEGDRPIQEVSLIEEAVEALERDPGMKVLPGETRRNVMTRGVPLNHLVGCEFRIAGTVLKGAELCEPCDHLVAVAGERGLQPDLIHRGGLHTRVLKSGTIRRGDPVEEVRTEEQTP